MNAPASLVYDRAGYCPICAAEVRFQARQAWFRDYLCCSGCGSIPRERGLALVLERRFPGWRGLAIHESSPADRGISAKLARGAPGLRREPVLRRARPSAPRSAASATRTSSA